MDKSDITFERLRSFVRVAERGSLSAVAREFGVGQSTITRHLRELEDSLGVALLSRTTRSVSLTDEGRRYYANVMEILRLLDEANDEIRGDREASSGIIRVSCSAFFGMMHLCRLIFAFQDRYPEINVDLVLTDERLDLVRDGVDLAIQIGHLVDSEMKLKPLGEARPMMVASPEYIARHGRPLRPEDLSTHEVIRKTNVPRSNQLSFTDSVGQVHVATFEARFRVDHGLASREALIAGRGIAPVPRWLVDDLLTDGRLEVLLPDYLLPATPLNMLLVPERANVTRVRLLKDFLAENIGTIPGVS